MTASSIAAPVGPLPEPQSPEASRPTPQSREPHSPEPQSAPQPAIASQDDLDTAKPETVQWGGHYWRRSHWRRRWYWRRRHWWRRSRRWRWGYWRR